MTVPRPRLGASVVRGLEQLGGESLPPRAKQHGMLGRRARTQPVEGLSPLKLRDLVKARSYLARLVAWHRAQVRERKVRA